MLKPNHQIEASLPDLNYQHLKLKTENLNLQNALLKNELMEKKRSPASEQNNKLPLIRHLFDYAIQGCSAAGLFFIALSVVKESVGILIKKCEEIESPPLEDSCEIASLGVGFGAAALSFFAIKKTLQCACSPRRMVSRNDSSYSISENDSSEESYIELQP